MRQESTFARGEKCGVEYPCVGAQGVLVYDNVCRLCHCLGSLVFRMACRCAWVNRKLGCQDSFQWRHHYFPMKLLQILWFQYWSVWKWPCGVLVIALCVNRCWFIVAQVLHDCKWTVGTESVCVGEYFHWFRFSTSFVDARWMGPAVVRDVCNSLRRIFSHCLVH